VDIKNIGTRKIRLVCGRMTRSYEASCRHEFFWSRLSPAPPPPQKDGHKDSFRDGMNSSGDIILYLECLEKGYENKKENTGNKENSTD
jgi:hypothetical protein